MEIFTAKEHSPGIMEAALMKANGKREENMGLADIPVPTVHAKEGNYKDGQFHGYGKATQPDGIVLEGDFKRGKLNGQERSHLPRAYFTKGFM